MGSEVGQTLQILLKYVKTDSKGVVDASNMFSKACYEHWLGKKNPKPKNPGEAFRKVINAHCEGKNGVQHFDKEVEEAVIKILRQKQVWQCFQKSKVNIGKRGSAVKGYWEQRQIQPNYSLRDIFNHLVWERFNTKKELSKKYTFEELDCLFSVFQQLLNSSTSEKTAFERYLSEKTEGKKREEMNDILFDALWRYMMMKRKIPEFLVTSYNNEPSFVFTKEFQIPMGDERCFLPFKPIGKLIDLPSNCTTVDTDEVCRSMYQGDITGTHCHDLHVYKATYFFFQDEVVNDLLNKGEAWNRTIENRCDGGIIVALNRYRLMSGSSDEVLVEMQDITDQYEKYLPQIPRRPIPDK